MMVTAQIGGPRTKSGVLLRKLRGVRAGVVGAVWIGGLMDWGARMDSYDSATREIPKSTGFSSTRGTVCYVDPEYSISGGLSGKRDVYSYGVLLLVG